MKLTLHLGFRRQFIVPFLLSFVLLAMPRGVFSQVIWSSNASTLWLTGGNWTGSAVPSSAQVAEFDVNPTAGNVLATAVGIDMGSTSPVRIQQVGAIYVSASRPNALIIGNSSLLQSGVLQINGVAGPINSISNLLIGNFAPVTGTSSTALTLNQTALTGNKTTSINFPTAGYNIAAGAGTSTIVGDTVWVTDSLKGNGFTFQGGGTLKSGGNNGGLLYLDVGSTFTGGVTVGKSDSTQDGVLNLNKVNAIAASNTITINPFSQLNLNVAGSYVSNPLVLNGKGNKATLFGRGALRNNGGATTWPGAITLNNGAQISAVGAAAGILTLSGAITNNTTAVDSTAPGASSTAIGPTIIASGGMSGAGSLTFLGGGTWNGTTGLSGGLLKETTTAFSSTGGITAGNNDGTSSGILELDIAPSNLAGNNITINNNSQLYLNATTGTTFTVGNLTLTLNGTGEAFSHATTGKGVLFTNAKSFTWTGPITRASNAWVSAVGAASTLTLSGAVTNNTSSTDSTAPGASSTAIGNTILYSGGMSGTGSLTFLGGGTWTGFVGNSGGLLKIISNPVSSTSGIIVGNSDGSSAGIIELDTTLSNLSGNNLTINNNSQLYLNATTGTTYPASNLTLTLNGNGFTATHATTGKGALIAKSKNFTWDGPMSLNNSAFISALGTNTLNFSKTFTTNTTAIDSTSPGASTTAIGSTIIYSGGTAGAGSIQFLGGGTWTGFGNLSGGLMKITSTPANHTGGIIVGSTTGTFASGILELDTTVTNTSGNNITVNNLSQIYLNATDGVTFNEGNLTLTLNGLGEAAAHTLTGKGALFIKNKSQNWNGPISLGSNSWIGAYGTNANTLTLGGAFSHSTFTCTDSVQSGGTTTLGPTINYTGNFSGSGGHTFTGGSWAGYSGNHGGLFKLGGNNSSYSGTFTVNAGNVLELNSPNAVAGGLTTVSSNGQLFLNATTGTTYTSSGTLTLNGGGPSNSLTYTGRGALFATGRSFTYSGAIAQTGGYINYQGGNGNTLTLSNTVTTTGTSTDTLGAGTSSLVGNTINMSGTHAGSGTLNILGGGTWNGFAGNYGGLVQLNGTNTYTGTYSVGAAAGTSTAILELAPSSSTLVGAVTVNNNSTFFLNPTAGSTINNSSNTLTLNGSGASNSLSYAGKGALFATSKSLTYNGPIAQTGAFINYQGGNGNTLTLSGTVTTTTTSTDTLGAGSGSVVGNIINMSGTHAGSGTLNLLGGGTWNGFAGNHGGLVQLSGTNTYTGTYSVGASDGSSSAVLELAQFSSTLTGAVTVNNNSTFFLNPVANSNIANASKILTLTGSGASNSLSYTGKGALVVKNKSVTYSGPVVSASSGSMIAAYGGTGKTLTLGSTVTLTGAMIDTTSPGNSSNVGNTISYTGVVSGAGTHTFLGGGTWNGYSGNHGGLFQMGGAGTNTFTGACTVGASDGTSNGILEISSNTGITAAAVTVNNNSALFLNPATGTTITNSQPVTLTGAGSSNSLTYTGKGALVANNKTVTYSGAGGIVSSASGSTIAAYGGTGFALNLGTTVTLTGAVIDTTTPGSSSALGNIINYTGIISGAGTHTILGGGTWNGTSGNYGGLVKLGGANTATGAIAVGNSDGTSNGVLEADVAGSFANNASNNITINNYSQLFLNGATNTNYSATLQTLNLNGYGPGNSLTNTGAGALYAKSSNLTWNSPVTMNNSSINYKGGNGFTLTFGTTSNFTTNGVTRIMTDGGSSTLPGNIIVNSGTLTNNGTINFLGGGSSTVTGGIWKIKGVSSNTGDINVGTATGTDSCGIIEIDTASALASTSAHTLTINPYSQLYLNALAASTTYAPNSITVSLNGIGNTATSYGAGALMVNGTKTHTWPGNITLANSSTMISSLGTATLNISGNISGIGTYNMAAGGTATAIGSTINVTGIMSGSGAVNTVLGNGTWNGTSGTAGGILKLANANTFSNGITVGTSGGASNAVLELDHNAAINNVLGNDVTINSNSTLFLNAATSSTYTTDNVNLYLNGAGNTNNTTNGTGAGLVGGALVCPAKTLTWTGPVTLASNAAISVQSGGTLTLSGSVTGSSTLTKLGAGTLVLSGTGNSNSGAATIINAGSITVTSGSSLDTGALTMAQVSGALTLTLNNPYQSINGLSSSWTATSFITDQIVLNGTRLRINQLTTGTYGSGSSATAISVITGSGSVVKTGPGLLILTSKDDNWTGGLKISAGEVRFNPNATGINLSSPDTLDGGTFSTTNYATPSPMTFGTLCLTNNSTIDVSSAISGGTSNLQFQASNTIAWTSGAVLKVTGWTGNWNGTAGTKTRLLVGTTSSGLTTAQLAQIVFVDANNNQFLATQLSNGEVVPKAPTITTTASSPGPFCVGTGGTFSVAFTSTGPITGTYKVQLSAANGVFPSDTVSNIIGTGTTAVAPISATISGATVHGSHYRVRVINGTPFQVYGSDNGTNIIDTTAPVPAIIGGSSVLVGLHTTLTDSSSGGTWSSADTTIATINPSTGVVFGASGGTVTISYGVTNLCGTGYRTGSLQVVSPPIIASVTPNTAKPLDTISIVGTGFNSTPTSNIVYFGAVKGTVLSTSTTTTLSVVVPKCASYAAIRVLNTTNGLIGAEDYAFRPLFDTSRLITSKLHFNAHVDLSTNAAPNISAIGDLDGDGKPDLVTCNTGGSGTDMNIYRNISSAGTITTGSFSAGTAVGGVASPINIKLADIDGDGKLDIIVTSAGASKVTCYRNTSSVGAISFGSGTILSTGSYPYPQVIAIVDIDGDGKLDVATVCNFSGVTGLLLFRNTSSIGTITFSGATVFATPPAPLSITTGDYDGDGKPDLAVLCGYNSSGATHVMAVYRNTASVGNIDATSLAAYNNFNTGTNPIDLATGDIDGDGKDDIAVTNNVDHTFQIYTNRCTSGTMMFDTTGTPVNTGLVPSGIALMDFNGDGKIDVVVDDGTSPGMNNVFRSSSTPGSISFVDSVNNTTAFTAYGVVTGDLDGDGYPDIVSAAYGNSKISIVQNLPIPKVSPIYGNNFVCAGGGLDTLHCDTLGGTWSITNSSLATIDATTGVLTGITHGSGTGFDTVYYTYNLGTLTNTVMYQISVNALPIVSPISGVANVCASSSVTLSETTPGGVWGVTNSHATIFAGIVSALTYGFDTATYTVTTSGCTTVVTGPFQIYELAYADTIRGNTIVCETAAITLVDTATDGGVWSSSNTGIATVSSTGVVTGVHYGTAIISFSASNVCNTSVDTMMVRVNPAPHISPISGFSSVCEAGATITLTDTVAGGNWGSTSPTNATVNSSGVVTGLVHGSTVITYSTTNSCGTLTQSDTITITQLANAGIITGTPILCEGTTSSLSDTATLGGWLTSNAAVATVDASGVVTGVHYGNAIISYSVTNVCNTSVDTMMVTITPAPQISVITGLSSVCEAGATITLADSIAGGTWNSLSPTNATVNSSGVVTGHVAGTAVITYTVTNSCGSLTKTDTITVNPLPSPGSITGTLNVCEGGATTSLGATVLGGTWSSSDTTKATVNSSGVATGVHFGSVTITYTVTNLCGSAFTTSTLVVNPLPWTPGAITGTAIACAGGGTTILSDTTLGGTWSSSDTTLASVDASGHVTGHIAGTPTITYTSTNSCGSRFNTTLFTVNSLPATPGVITGHNNICIGSTDTLHNSVGGGTWSTTSSNATMGSSSGAITANLVGTAIITYTTSSSCGSSSVFDTVTIVGYPTATIISAAIPCTGHATSIVIGGPNGDTVGYKIDGGSINHGVISSGTFSFSSGVISSAHTYTLFNLSNGTCVSILDTTTTITPQSMTWVGGTTGVATDWNTAANWSCDVVPGASDNVTIHLNAYPPVVGVSGTAYTQNLTLDSGVVITMNSGSDLSIAGNLVNNGKISGAGTATMSGTSAQTITGIGTVTNLEINNTNGATIGSSSKVTVTNTLNMTAGNLATNDSLFMYSDATGTARITPMGTGALISGNVRVMQYFEGAYRCYRFVGHPFSSSIPLSQIEQYIDITGTNPAANGFTPTITNAYSCFWYNPTYGNSSIGNDPGWRAFTNVWGTPDTNMFHQYQGIRLYVRGSKGEGLNGGTYTIDPVTLTMYGPVNQGKQVVHMTKGSGAHADYNQLSNPYASPVNVRGVIKSAKDAGNVVGGAFYLFDPTLGTTGQFRAIPINSSPYNLPAATSYQVRTGHNGDTLVFQESDKCAVDSITTLLKVEPEYVTLNILDNQYHPWDILQLQFTSDATDMEDGDDAEKLLGGDLNFYSLSSDDNKLALDLRPFKAEKVIPLGITSNYNQEFIIKVQGLSVPDNGRLYLHDKLLKQYVLLEQGTEYKFNVADDKTTQGDQRFELNMEPAGINPPKNGGIFALMTPNPASDEVKVEFNCLTKDEVKLRVMDISGVVVYSTNEGVQQSGIFSVPVKGLASGVYIFEMTSGDQHFTQRIIKE